MSDGSDAFVLARNRLEAFVGDLVSRDLFEEWSVAANELYKEQFAKKENPYGEAWEPRPGDDKRTKSYYKFGRVTEVDRGSFTLAVAAPNAKRSCVPFEPRGLGAWRPRFDDILKDRAWRLFRSVVRP
jgi:hypothetical protein